MASASKIALVTGAGSGAGQGVDRFMDYKGLAIDVELHRRQPAAFAAQVRAAGFSVEQAMVRPPYPFEHATERLYVTARAV